MSVRAKEIYQDLLDRFTRALRARDVSYWTDCMALPHIMTTSDGRLVLETQEDVKTTFADYLSGLDKLGVAEATRTCKIARVSEPGWIQGYHTTAMIQEDGEALPGYTVKWTLCEDENGPWRVKKTDSALKTVTMDKGPYDQMKLLRRLEARSDLKFRQEVQACVDLIDTTLLHGDFDAWLRVFKLPIVLQTPKGQTILDSPERLRQDYELYREAFRINRVTDFTRVVRNAEQIDENLIVATYRAHLMSGARYVVDPWNAALTLTRSDDGWHISKLIGSFGPLYWRTAPYGEGVTPLSGAAQTTPQAYKSRKTGRQ